jgi:hypothetical protein
MKYTLKKTVLLTIGLAGLGLAPAIRADHATNFLDGLQNEVNNQIANTDTNITAAQRTALRRADDILDNDTETLRGDLSLLTEAAIVLNARWSNYFLGYENQAVLDYANEAQARLNAVKALNGANDPPPALSNAINSAQHAIDRATEQTNSIPTRARAVRFALNKIRVAANLSHRLFKAPLSLDGKVLRVSAREFDRDRLTIVLAEDHTYRIPAHSEEFGENADELGTWSYERTGRSTARVTLTPNTPPGSGAHVMNLKFNTRSKGEVLRTSRTATNESFSGHFTVSDD